MSMIIPKGYKKTEVGIIPDDWEVKRVGDICDFIVPGRNKPKKFEGDIPWITTPDIEEGRYVAKSRLGLCISIDEAKKVGSKVVPAGSVLMSCAGELGIVAFTENKIVINQQLHAFIPSSIIDALFLLNAIKTQKKYIDSVATKTAVPYINKDNCNSIPIPLPPLNEQKAIAQSLGDVDALITALDQLIIKKRNIKQGMMQQLLTGKKRLPGFSGEWVVKAFDEVMTGFSSGSTPSRRIPHFYKGDIKWITSGELNYKVINDTYEKITEEAVIKTNLTIHEPGTFFIAITGLEAVGTRGSCGINGTSATTNQSCMALYTKKEQLTIHYLFYYYVNFGENLALKFCQGTKQQSYNAQIVKKLPIYLPPTIEEQKAIAQVLSDMDAEITALEQKHDKYKAIKQGMMQELLTGKTRLL